MKRQKRFHQPRFHSISENLIILTTFQTSKHPLWYPNFSIVGLSTNATKHTLSCLYRLGSRLLVCVMYPCAKRGSHDHNLTIPKPQLFDEPAATREQNRNSFAQLLYPYRRIYRSHSPYATLPAVSVSRLEVAAFLVLRYCTPSYFFFFLTFLCFLGSSPEVKSRPRYRLHTSPNTPFAIQLSL